MKNFYSLMFNKSLNKGLFGLIFLFLTYSNHSNAQCSCVWIGSTGLITCYVGNCSSGAYSDCLSADLSTGGALCTTWQDCPLPPTATNGCSYGCTSAGACWFNGNACRNSEICDLYNASPLPITLISLKGENRNSENVITWATASEQNNDYFTLSYSFDGVNYVDFITFSGAGNSSEELGYMAIHTDFEKSINYYKLTQTDFDGTTAVYGPISIDNRAQKRTLLKVCNMLGQEVNENYRGIVIYHYSDGSYEKIYK
jgi:hypothetical protein